MHKSWCGNELRLSILVRNENELLWSSADYVILVVYSIKFVFNCLSSSGWIGSGTNRFGPFWVRVYIGSIRVRVSSGSIRVISDFESIRVITVSDRFDFWVGSILNFGSKSVQLFVMSVWIWFRIVWFGSFDSSHFCQHDRSSCVHKYVAIIYIVGSVSLCKFCFWVIIILR